MLHLHWEGMGWKYQQFTTTTFLFLKLFSLIPTHLISRNCTWNSHAKQCSVLHCTRSSFERGAITLRWSCRVGDTTSAANCVKEEGGKGNLCSLYFFFPCDPLYGDQSIQFLFLALSLPSCVIWGSNKHFLISSQSCSSANSWPLPLQLSAKENSHDCKIAVLQ